jgi:hypothetical protein
MKYIDKSTNQVAGMAIVNELLADSWDGSIYYGADYDGLKKPKYKNRFTYLLLAEQGYHCCYCMKHILPANTTLEHIIPQEVKEADFGSYLVVPELTNNVVYKNSFNRSTRVIPPLKYPHDIAYHNIIASCNSNSHCNNKRGDKPIKPLIYDPAIESKVIYDRAGNIKCDEYENDLFNIGLLRTKNPLNLIRLIWYKLSQKYEEFVQITSEAINDIINDLITLFDDISIIDNFLGEPSYNTEVIKYGWFFDYYKRNNN